MDPLGQFIIAVGEHLEDYMTLLLPAIPWELPLLGATSTTLLAIRPALGGAYDRSRNRTCSNRLALLIPR